MILALALLTVTQLAPESTAARLLEPETVGIAGGPRQVVVREQIPGLKPAWAPLVVAGAITVTGGLVTVIALVAGRAGGFVGLAVAVLFGLVTGTVHIICGAISAVFGFENQSLRKAYQEHKRTPAPVGAAPLQPTAVVFRF